MIGNAPKCPKNGKRSNTVFIIQITCASILITFVGASLTLIFGKPEDPSNYLDFAGQVVLWLGAAGGITAPAKKLGDAWHDKGKAQPTPPTPAPRPAVSSAPAPPTTPTAEDTPTEPEKQCSNCGMLNPGDPCSNCGAAQS